LNVVFPNANPMALDLLSKLMTFNHNKRISVLDALEHPYLQALHFPDDEPVRDVVPEGEFEFEKHTLSLEQLKDLIYEEILLYHFEDFSNKYFTKIKKGQNPIEDVMKNENALKPGEKESDDEDEDD